MQQAASDHTRHPNSSAENGFTTSNVTSNFFLGGQTRPWMATGSDGARPEMGVRSRMNHSTVVPSPPVSTKARLERPDSVLAGAAQKGLRSLSKPSRVAKPQGKAACTIPEITSAGNPILTSASLSTTISDGNHVMRPNSGAVDTQGSSAPPPAAKSSTGVFTQASRPMNLPHAVQQILSPSASPPQDQQSRKRSLGGIKADAQKTIRLRMSTYTGPLIRQHVASPISPMQTPLPTPSPTIIRFLPILDALTTRFRAQGQYGQFEDQRAALLHWACVQDDLFYLCLHQIYCLFTLNLLSTVGFEYSDPQTRGFAPLGAILLPDRQLPFEVLHGFANFPVPALSLPRDLELAPYIAQVKTFLPNLSSKWDLLRNHCFKRGFPPCARELRSQLAVPSTILQRTLFNSVHRELGHIENISWQRQAMLYFDTNQRAFVLALSQPDAHRTQHEVSEPAEIEAFGKGYIALHRHLVGHPQPSQNAWTVQTQTATGLGNRHPGFIGSADYPAQASGTQQQHNGAVQVPLFQASYGLTQPVLAPPLPFYDPYSTRFAGPSQAPQTTAQAASGSHTLTSSNVPFTRPKRGRPPNQSYKAPQGLQGYRVAQQPPLSIGRTVSKPAQAALHDWSPSSQAPMMQPQAQMRGPVAYPMSSRQQPLATSFIPPLNLILGQINNPNTARIALHQAQLQSPEPLKISLRGDVEQNLRLYQYLERFALHPQPLGDKCPYFEWQINIPLTDIKLLAKDIPVRPDRPDQRQQRKFMVGSKLFRMRCVQLPCTPTSTDATPAEWVVTATSWPSCCFVSIDGRDLEIRRKSHHGRDLALDLTPFLREGKNNISMSIHRTPEELTKNFAVSVEVLDVVDHMTAAAMPYELTSEQSLSTIMSTLSGTSGESARGDEEVEMLGSHVSIDLFDPFMSTIFQAPVRGRTCIHRECFDLEAFLQSRTSRSKGGPSNPDEWRCPICGKDARPSELVVDGFLVSVRKQLEEKGELGTKAILVNADGTWEPKLETGNEAEKDWERTDLLRVENEWGDTTGRQGSRPPLSVVTAGCVGGAEIIELDD